MLQSYTKQCGEMLRRYTATTVSSDLQDRVSCADLSYTHDHRSKVGVVDYSLQIIIIDLGSTISLGSPGDLLSLGDLIISFISISYVDILLLQFPQIFLGELELDFLIHPFFLYPWWRSSSGPS